MFQVSIKIRISTLLSSFQLADLGCTFTERYLIEVTLFFVAEMFKIRVRRGQERHSTEQQSLNKEASKIWLQTGQLLLNQISEGSLIQKYKV